MAHLPLGNKLANAPALSLLPDLNEPPVQPALGHQLRMGALLDDAAILHHQNLVGVLDGGQPVGDGEDRLSLGQGGQGLLDQVLILRIHAGGGLVQNHDGRILQNRPGDGDALALAAGEGGAPLPDHRVIPIWQGHDEVMAAGGPGSGHHLLMGGVGASEFDVVLHTVLEEIHILKNHGDIPQQALAGELTHIVAADGHGPLSAS